LCAGVDQNNTLITFLNYISSILKWCDG